MSIPEPTTFNGAPGDDYYEGGGVKYRCLDCRWHGKSAQAVDHHQVAHHRIAIAAIGVVVPFACCAGKKEREVA